MHNTLSKKFALVLLVGFFLTIVAVAFHYHDNTFLLRSCSICKVKASISGTMSKNNVDSAPADMIVSIGLGEIFLVSASAIKENTTIVTSSQVVHIFPNKAPPFRS